MARRSAALLNYGPNFHVDERATATSFFAATLSTGSIPIFILLFSPPHHFLTISHLGDLSHIDVDYLHPLSPLQVRLA